MGDVLDYLFDLFKILIPSMAVVVVVQVMLRNHYDDQKRRDELIVYKSNIAEIRPLRIQAYERLILFLERIQSNQLIMRCQIPNASAMSVQMEMLKSIRTEYQHNMTQQLYISSTAWQLVIKAKDEMSKIVNLTASQLPEDATGIDFVSLLVDVTGQIPKSPTDVAIEGLKLEFQTKFKS